MMEKSSRFDFIFRFPPLLSFNLRNRTEYSWLVEALTFPVLRGNNLIEEKNRFLRCQRFHSVSLPPSTNSTTFFNPSFSPHTLYMCLCTKSMTISNVCLFCDRIQSKNDLSGEVTSPEQFLDWSVREIPFKPRLNLFWTTKCPQTVSAR